MNQFAGDDQSDPRFAGRVSVSVSVGVSVFE